MKNLFWNSAERRPRALWRLLIHALLFATTLSYIAVPILAIQAFLPQLMPAQAPGAAGGSYGETLTFLTLVSMITLVAAVFSTWVAACWVDRRPFWDLGLRFDRAWWAELFFGLVLGAVLMAGIFAVELGMGWIEVESAGNPAGGGRPLLTNLTLSLILCICVGIYEELLSRGYQLRNIAEALNVPLLGPSGAVVAALAITSAMFGFEHFLNPNVSIIGLVNIAAHGLLLLGLAFVLTGRLALPIGLHITWNLFQGAVFGFPVSGMKLGQIPLVRIAHSGPDLWTGGSFGPEGGLVGLLAIALGGLLVLTWVRLRTGRIRLQTALARPRFIDETVRSPAAVNPIFPL